MGHVPHVVADPPVSGSWDDGRSGREIRAAFLGLGPGMAGIDAFRRFLAAHPLSSAIPVVEPDPDPRLVIELGRAGVSSVLVWEGAEDLGSWRRRVRAALFGAEADLVRRRCDGCPEMVTECLCWAVQHAAEKPSVGDLAEAFGLTRSALSRRLKGEGGPSPNRLLVAGRILQASMRMQCTECSIEKAAMEVGFAEESGLRRAQRRFVDEPPSSMRQCGFQERLLNALLRPRRDDVSPAYH